MLINKNSNINYPDIAQFTYCIGNNWLGLVCTSFNADRTYMRIERIQKHQPSNSEKVVLLL